MAVGFDGGVVIGADSHTSTGVYVANRVSNKLTFVHEEYFVADQVVQQIPKQYQML